eukprot:TRINITY_DN1083_c0_g1_i1.p1 TRINITY_DN1083_c0_g1~~TRINITY_DN1083_c0_g1_i1.p1  ORF type:complete len:131 (-),score=28.45 TRINITY_DN1083_c0_g1_i1:233-589(-)
MPLDLDGIPENSISNLGGGEFPAGDDSADEEEVAAADDPKNSDKDAQIQNLRARVLSTQKTEEMINAEVKRNTTARGSIIFERNIIKHLIEEHTNDDAPEVYQGGLEETQCSQTISTI